MQQFPDWLIWEASLDDEMCDKILEACEKLPSKNATTFRAGEDPLYEDPNRKTQIRWVPRDGEHDWINQIFEAYAREANKHFGMELSYLPELQFTEYKDVGHFYGDHHDVDWDRSDGRHRKISIVVQLSDPKEYTGGDFTFMTTQSPDPITVKKRGTVIAFVSYYDHAVSPILSGSRTSLVGWYEGPRWK